MTAGVRDLGHDDRRVSGISDTMTAGVRDLGHTGMRLRRPAWDARLPSVARWLQGWSRMTLADDMPRERMFALGGEALAAKELIALVLGTGAAGKSATDVAEALLAHAGGLEALSNENVRALCAVTGVGPARAARLVAAFSLGRRSLAPRGAMTAIRNPADVYHHLGPRMKGLAQESFWVLALDARNTIISEQEIARGSLTSVCVHPREVFRPLIRQAAAAAVVAHNHPSGNPAPSQQDIALTRRLLQAGDLLGIPILDHVVIGASDYRSMIEDVVGSLGFAAAGGDEDGPPTGPPDDVTRLAPPPAGGAPPGSSPSEPEGVW